MDKSFEVRVIQQNGRDVIRFIFNKLIDAMQFVEVCLECGEENTVVSIKRMKKELE